MPFTRVSKWAGLVAALCSAPLLLATDHLDSPSLAADPASDITDLYTWVEGPNLVLVMNVFPSATMASKFAADVQYVFHTQSAAGFLNPGPGVDVLCTFDAAQLVSCWGGGSYVTGDASGTAGLTSRDGKLKVFAGVRDDPAFFNREGFEDMVTVVKGAAGGLALDPAGCPTLDAATSQALVTRLRGTQGGTALAKDSFQGKNVLSLVVSIDKSLVTAGGRFVSVWGSTNK